MSEVGKRLRMLRIERGLRQREVAKLSGMGVKTISSFETGDRVESLKLGQLQRLLAIYGVTEREFFGDVRHPEFDGEDVARGMHHVSRRLASLPEAARDALLSKMELMVDTAAEMQALSRPRPYVQPPSDWQLLNSHN